MTIEKGLFNRLDANKHVGIFLLRIFIGTRLIYGVIDNVINWGHMLKFADFLALHGFPLPILSAVISVYAQLTCGIFIVLGYSTRLASMIMAFNFLIALFFVHIATGDSVEGMTPALAMLFGCSALVFTGADKISLDFYSKRRN